MKRSLVPLVAALAVLKLATLAGCSDECGDFASLVCEKKGEDDPGCKKLRQQSESTSLDDKRACGKALTVANDFMPKK